MGLVKKLVPQGNRSNHGFLWQFDMSNLSYTSTKITDETNRTIPYLMIVFFFSLKNGNHEN